MSTILLTTTGTDGDVVQFLEIGGALTSRGHAVTLITHGYYEQRARAAGLAFVPLDTPEEYARLIEGTAGLMEHMHDLAAIRAFRQEHGFDRKVQREYKAIKALHQPGDTAVVARHLSGVAAHAAAEEVGLPFAWMLLWPSMLTTLPIAEELHGAALLDDLNAERALLGRPAVQDWKQWATGPRRQIGLWPEWFGPADARWPEVQLTGFVRNDRAESGPLPAAVQGFLAQGEPPVLITGGTGMMLGAAFYRAAVQGCRQAGRRALLVTRHRHLVPDRLPPAVLCCERLPFASVMPQVRAVIHHGGISTSGRALWAGVPQLILADGVDRPDNAQRLQQLGVGEGLLAPQWKAEVVAGALQRIDTPGVRERAAHYARLVRSVDGTEAACSAIEEMVGDPRFVLNT